MAMTTSGTVSTALTQKRRIMSANSGLVSSSTVTVRSSRVMPQIGQLPGASRMISGCIGQVYSVRVVGVGTPTGSKAIPHLEQTPG